ncbi:Hsp70 family protein [Phytomonospora sp. NPDC050363]|uniref:Hsp70 family protein n=1 Tax=Phytomonospora sp. NPDC050363 TaxID=3155642 RepID=UPI0033F0DC92
MSSPHLGIDFGTSHTVATLVRAEGSVEPLLFDGSPLLPSAVYAESGGELIVGTDARHAARMRPDRCEPHPKRRVDDGTVLLGEREFAVTDLFAAVLSQVRRRCAEVNGSVPPQVTLTHPASWGPTRRQVLLQGARAAGLRDVRLMPEPVAAARFYVHAMRQEVPVGGAVAVHDFGGGTFDASVVRRTASGFEVLSVDGLDNLGGIDIDEAVIGRLKSAIGHSKAAEMIETREAWLFREDVRRVKESLSRRASAELYVPGGADVHVTRDELDALAAPMLARAVTVTKAVVTDSGVAPASLAAVFLVGGASRMPLVATLLHRALGVAPVAADDLEQVVARGAVLAEPPVVQAPGSAPPIPAQPTGSPQSPAPMASPPVSAPPVVSAPPAPVSGAHAVYPPPTQQPVYPPPPSPTFGAPASFGPPPATVHRSVLSADAALALVGNRQGPPAPLRSKRSPGTAPKTPSGVATVFESLKAGLGPPGLWIIAACLLFGASMSPLMGGDLGEYSWFGEGGFGSDTETFVITCRFILLIAAGSLLLLHRLRAPAVRWALVGGFAVASLGLIVAALTMIGFEDWDYGPVHLLYSGVALLALELLFTDSVAEWYRSEYRLPVPMVTRWFLGCAVLALSFALAGTIEAVA